MSLKNAALQLSTIERLFVIAVIIFGAGVSVATTWTAIQESPQLLNQAISVANESMDSTSSLKMHVGMHHDSIVDLSIVVPQILEHFEIEEAADIVRDSVIRRYGERQEYLICLREQRALEVSDQPTTRNCADDLILGR